VIIAMRDEIARMKSCNEEQAVEHLMAVIFFRCCFEYCIKRNRQRLIVESI
jgi:hypothetical protein